jgi:hypothetical protein
VVSALCACGAVLLLFPLSADRGGEALGESFSGAAGISWWRGYLAAEAFQRGASRICFFGLCAASMVEELAGAIGREPHVFSQALLLLSALSR